MLGGSDADTGDMQVAVSELNRIVRRTGAAIEIVHHAGWNDSHERGSTVLRGACRVVARLSNDDGLITLACEMTNGVGFEPRRFRLIERKIEDGRRSAVLIPAQMVDLRDAKLTPRERETLEALTLATFRKGVSFTDLNKHLGHPNSTLNRSLSKLIERNFVEKRGRRYLPTDSGLAEAQSIQAGTESASSEAKEKTELALNWSVNFRAFILPSSVKVQLIFQQLPILFSLPSGGRFIVHSALSLGESGIVNLTELNGTEEGTL